MVGGCLSCLFTYISVLLFWICLHDVEASSCQHDIHKKVGDTVEISSCLPTEGVVMARWKYGPTVIADKDTNVSVNHQFKGRLDFNPTNFSLTLRGLTLKDSGEFSFLSALNGQQRETVTITLHVHEPITEEPVVSSNITWHPLNQSCTVFLTCSAASHSNVIYRWAEKNQNINGSSLNNIIMSQDEDTNFTCTVSNVVSEKSTSKVVKCSNSTSDPPVGPGFIILLGAAGGSCVMLIILVAVAVCFCHRKKSQAGVDTHDLTVYADISDVANEAGTAMKSCTLYETIENKVVTAPAVPQTVYDQIQFNRMNASVSPYQEIS
ncbi:SLAM family member 5-like [Plectropomus leopardus]|uniref:SLAM family member 5-like n=1 Tax=Plectropomus leopardus TaxID=160734 RepID=UPI001C4DD324|nr:SLAM family member 5-like [Plectropomus leopardus]